MVHFEVDDLGKRFGRRILFRSLGFVLDGGASLAITGANGSGKSTLLRILAGLLSPSKGSIALHYGGRRLAAEERPLHIGYVAPYLNVYDDFTARENLHFLARARRLPAAETRMARVLELVELGERADELVRTYSSGMKQRVKYAAALLAEPQVLMLDEPTSNLDVAGLQMVERVAAHQTAQGGILLVATNDAHEAARCDRTLRIEDFRV